MKKSDVSVGMSVTTPRGLEGTVVAVGGWYPEVIAERCETLVVDGVERPVDGYRFPRTHGILIAFPGIETLHVWQAKNLTPA